MMTQSRPITPKAVAHAIYDAIACFAASLMLIVMVALVALCGLGVVSLCIGAQVNLLEWAVDHPIGLAYYWGSLFGIVTAGHILTTLSLLTAVRRLSEEERTALPSDTNIRCGWAIAKNIAITMTSIFALWAVISWLDPPMLTIENAHSRSLMTDLMAAVLTPPLGIIPIIHVWNQRTSGDCSTRV